MTVDAALATAVSGLNASSRQFQVAANNIVNAGSDGFKAREARTFSSVAADGGARSVGVDVTITDADVDLAREAVNSIQAQASYNANAQVIRSISDLAGQLFDISG